MTHGHDRFLELAAAEALGSLSDGERHELARHVAACASCRDAVAAYRDAAVDLARSLPPSTPSPAVRARVLASVRPTEREPALRPAVSAARPWQQAAAALLLLGLGVGWLLWSDARALREAAQDTQVRHEAAVQDLQDQVTTAQADAAAKEAEVQRLLALLGDAQARVATLEATANGSAATSGRVAYDPATGRAVVILPRLDAPAGKDYQLWSIRADEGADPVIRSLGIVRRSAEGPTILVIERMPEGMTPHQIALSLENTGGASTTTAPDGPVVAAAALP